MSSIINKIDLIPRKIINRMAYPFQRKGLNKLHEALSKIEPNSPQYCTEMALLTERLPFKGDILCNFEEGGIKQIANSDMPVIFVMNHSKQKSDPKMFATLNSLLALEYLQAGKAANFPKPKIILNENIVKSAVRQMQDMYERFGAIGINIHERTVGNIREMRKLIEGYISGKFNIFIFPEGKNCVKKKLPFEERFQNGVSKMIQKILNSGKPVKVVPLGFGYGNDKAIFGSIFVGKPVYFRKLNGRVYTNIANAGSEFAPESLKSSFAKGHQIRTVNGTKGISEQIIENMKISMKEAEKRYNSPDSITLDSL